MSSTNLIFSEYNMTKFNFDAYDKFEGTRAEFVELMRAREVSEPSLMLVSKKNGSPIPCSIRRLDSLSTIGVFPKPNEDQLKRDGRGRPSLKMTAEHCYRYELHQRLRKSGQKIEGIASLMSTLGPKEIKEKVISWSIKFDTSELLDDWESEERELSEGLRRLGRETGNILISHQTRFAILPWLHLYAGEEQLKKLSSQDIDLLTRALNLKLKKHLALV